jgi:hypothetical protein
VTTERALSKIARDDGIDEGTEKVSPVIDESEKESGVKVDTPWYIFPRRILREVSGFKKEERFDCAALNATRQLGVDWVSKT